MDNIITSIVPNFINQLIAKERGIIIPPINVEVSSSFQQQKWPEKDIKELKDFCEKHSITETDFNKNISPIIIIGLLKKKFGIVDNTFLENIRKPTGYDKLGKFNKDYSYTQMVRRKSFPKN